MFAPTIPILLQGKTQLLILVHSLTYIYCVELYNYLNFRIATMYPNEKNIFLCFGKSLYYNNDPDFSCNGNKF